MSRSRMNAWLDGLNRHLCGMDYPPQQSPTGSVRKNPKGAPIDEISERTP